MNKKWNYAAVGLCVNNCLYMAILHHAGLVAMNFFLAVINWYAAEHRNELPKD